VTCKLRGMLRVFKYFARCCMYADFRTMERTTPFTLSPLQSTGLAVLGSRCGGNLGPQDHIVEGL
jgi:hypothetical protein